MCSTGLRYVTTEQLRLIAEILEDAGCSADIFGHAPPNVAARLPISCVQDGMSDPIDLARELESRLQSRPRSAARGRSIRHLADRGLSIRFGLEQP
jgi:hypothetical protein